MKVLEPCFEEVARLLFVKYSKDSLYKVLFFLLNLSMKFFKSGYANESVKLFC